MKSVLILAAMLLLLSCQTTTSHSGVSEDDAPCPEGQSIFFMIAPRDPTPATTDLPFDGVEDVFAPDHSWKLRLTVCLDEQSGEAELTQVKFMFDHNYSFEIKPGPGDIVEGLFPALFGETSALNIRVQTGREFNPVFAIKGGHDDHGPFVAAAEVDPARGHQPRYGMAAAGSLDLGDPFSDHLCAGRRQREYQIKFDRLELDLVRCEFLGGGQTLGYEYKLIEVRDSSEEVENDQRGVAISLDQEAIAEQVQYEFIHHNDNDYLEIDVGHANYRIVQNRLQGFTDLTRQYSGNDHSYQGRYPCSYYWTCGLQGPVPF